MSRNGQSRDEEYKRRRAKEAILQARHCCSPPKTLSEKRRCLSEIRSWFSESGPQSSRLRLTVFGSSHRSVSSTQTDLCDSRASLWAASDPGLLSSFFPGGVWDQHQSSLAGKPLIQNVIFSSNPFWVSF